MNIAWQMCKANWSARRRCMQRYRWAQQAGKYAANQNIYYIVGGK